MPENFDRFTQPFASLFHTNMGAVAGERIVVFSDSIRPDETADSHDADRRQRLTRAAEAAAAFAADRYGNTSFVRFPSTAASGAEPPLELWRTVFGGAILERLADAGLINPLLNKTIDDAGLAAARTIVLAHRDDVAAVVIAMSNNSTSHTRFRALATAAGGRFASLPHFDPDMFFSSMQVDWQMLKTRTDRLAAALQGAVSIRLVTPNGTDMYFGCAGRTAKGDDGILTAPGSFGNLPAGEVYLAPLEGTSHGTMVLEYAPVGELRTPVVLTVRDGNVTGISGDEPLAYYLRNACEEQPLVRNIAELGIGTNDRASRPDNILEAEKILGTIHIALGDNSGFGGTVQVPFHEDYVFFRPTLTAVFGNGTELTLLRDGALFPDE